MPNSQLGPILMLTSPMHAMTCTARQQEGAAMHTSQDVGKWLLAADMPDAAGDQLGHAVPVKPVLHLQESTHGPQ